MAKIPRWVGRFLLVTAGLAAWFATQRLLGGRPPGTGIQDGMFHALAPLHAWLMARPRACNALLIASSAGIDAIGAFLLLRSIFGPTIRPFLALLLLFGLRQACQALCALPAPPGLIWHDPGVPSLLVTYGVANDFFFSGHTALAVLGAVELCRTRWRSLMVIGIALALFEAMAVLALRAHYTMDVYAGVVTALLVGIAAGPIARPVDRWLERMRAASGPATR
jgi:hypothetical protein